MQTYWIWLAQKPNLVPRDKKQLLSHFGDIQSLYRADKAQLSRLGLKGRALAALADKELSESQAIVQACAQKHIGILTYGDEAYPAALRQIVDPPLVLYTLGKVPDWEKLAAIGVVGTRKATPFGRDTARRISGELVRCGAAVISGMASGVDTAATEGALDHGGIALGVLGCGIDRIYPANNRALYYRMYAQGCLLSEYPPGTQPQKWYFPARNRIISGLSLGVLVVEAPEKSGALITARAALEQNRDVFAVPAPDAPAYAGGNDLIAQGATPAASGWGLLSTYSRRLPGRFWEAPPLPGHSWDIATSVPAPAPGTPERSDKKSIDKGAAPPYSVVENRPGLSPQAQAVLAALSQGDADMDDVIARAGLDPSNSLAVLTMLEMRGLIVRLGGRRIALGKPKK